MAKFQISKEKCHFWHDSIEYIYAGWGNKKGEVLGQTLDTHDNFSFPEKDCLTELEFRKLNTIKHDNVGNYLLV